MGSHSRRVHAHTGQVHVQTDVSMCTPDISMHKPDVSMHMHSICAHTHTPDTSPYTHTRPCANLRRPRTHTPDQHHMPAAGATSDPEIPGAGTRVGFSFPQAHTSVHVHAARCYLCNHIATPPRILPYKDIGSHCCALFMAFHTHTRMHTATALLQLRTR